MRKSLIISIVWLWGTWAFGQCGSASNSDLDGPYVSSTSTDKCSGGGHIGPLVENTPSGLERHPPYRSYESSVSIRVLSFGRQNTVRLVPPLLLVERFNQVHDAAECLPFSPLQTANGPWRPNRKTILRAALERGEQ